MGKEGNKIYLTNEDIIRYKSNSGDDWKMVEVISKAAKAAEDSKTVITLNIMMTSFTLTWMKYTSLNNALMMILTMIYNMIFVENGPH